MQLKRQARPIMVVNVPGLPSARAFVPAVLGLLLSWPCLAMVFHSTDDPDFNTTSPEGYYADSGWQWQGLWGNGTATIVSRSQILTARHFAPAEAFVHDGKVYRVLGYIDDHASDLRLVALDMSEHGYFRSWAPLYTGGSELGREVVVHGRGYGRGPEVVVDGRLRGWLYQPRGDRRLRWGTNNIAGYADGEFVKDGLLRASFDLAGMPTQCHLAQWDSGGGVFIRDRGIWRLAGVNFSVDSRFATVTGDTGSFDAALFDVRGLVQGGYPVPDSFGHIPSSFYATRVSRRLAWLLPNLDRPVPRQNPQMTETLAGRRVAELAVLLLAATWAFSSRSVRRGRWIAASNQTP